MSEQKTHAEIIARMRSDAEEDKYTPDGILGQTLHSLADSLEAAQRREIDVLKRRINELDAEIAAKDEVIKRLNDAIAEDQRRKMATAENSSAVGDAAKLREAMRLVSRVAEQMTRGTITREAPTRKEVDDWAMRLCDIIGAALAAQRGTAALSAQEWAQMPYESDVAK